MNSILNVSGQTFVIDAINASITALGGLYVGLMTTTGLPAETANLNTGITEITGTGYARLINSTWTKLAGVDPTLQGEAITFTVPSGQIWSDVNGYFVSLSLTGPDILWSEEFETANKGNKSQGEKIIITPKYEQKYDGEI